MYVRYYEIQDLTFIILPHLLFFFILLVTLVIKYIGLCCVAHTHTTHNTQHTNRDTNTPARARTHTHACTHITTQNIQINLKIRQMECLIRCKSKLFTENKTLLYKFLLKSMWIYEAVLSHPI